MEAGIRLAALVIPWRITEAVAFIYEGGEEVPAS
jgi:hypothetical protein